MEFCLVLPVMVNFEGKVPELYNKNFTPKTLGMHDLWKGKDVKIIVRRQNVLTPGEI